MIKPIETQYKGYRFRSRLEARWAVFFDTLGVKWEYEPEGFDLGEAGWYLPDFKIETEVLRCWIEVKPELPSAEERAKLQALVDGSGLDGFFLCGSPGLPVTHRGIRSVKVEGADILRIVPGGYDFREEFGESHPLPALCQKWNETVRYGFFETPRGEVDINLLYIEDPLTSGVHHMIGAYGDIRPGLYMGPGRKYRSARIGRAYAAARSARFGRGGRG